MSVALRAPATDLACSRGTARDEFLALWTNTPGVMPDLGSEVGFFRKRSNARAASRLIDHVAAEIERLPPGEPPGAAWREAIRERLQQFGEERLGWPAGYRNLLFGDAFYESTVAFTREARDFDSRFSLIDLGQALRNVWIGNCIQMLLDRPVELRHGLFAYSMLYPVTDNLLDDHNVPRSRKRAFNERFGRRLAGLPAGIEDEHDIAVSRLVDQIEEEFPRQQFPSVYASLLAIHAAQIRSLDQHDGSRLSDAELASISFEKGGSSVLTDLHLVCPDATPAQERFAFGYGVFLQLLDDLQDVETDLEAGHETIFTRAARGGPLDQITGRLARFIDAVLAMEGVFDAPAFAERIDLIRRNCRALLGGSVGEHRTRFSRPFRRRVERQWPVSFRAQRRLRHRALRLTRFAWPADGRRLDAASAALPVRP